MGAFAANAEPRLASCPQNTPCDNRPNGKAEGILILKKNAGPASTTTAALNAKILSDPKRFQRLARANTRRLSGKSRL